MAASETTSASGVNLTASSGEEVISHQLIAIYKVLALYLWMVPVIFGIPGNIISVMVANRKHNRHLSPCIYITAMAVVDTALLVTLAWFFPFINMNLGSSITHEKGFLVCFVWYFVFTCAMMSGIFLVEMSIDRLIAVKFPMAAPRLCTTSRAKKTVIGTAIIITILNIHMFFAYVYVKDPVSGAEVLIISIPGYPVLEMLASGFQLVIGSFVPFLLIVAFNLIIIITLRQAFKEREKLNPGQSKDQAKKTDAHLTRMLICVSVAYVVTSVPYRLFHVAMSIPALSQMYDLYDPYWNIRYNVLVMVWFILWLFNYSINFYLYCVGGGQKYRKDTAEICGQILTCLRRNRADRN